MMAYGLDLVGYFLGWTFIAYWTHRAAHAFDFLWKFHREHHVVVYEGKFEFSWWNLVGWVNDWKSTLDDWLTEIIPLGLYIWIFPAAWPVVIYYYIDSSLSEGILDHNPRIDVPGLAMGRYHLAHHDDMRVNFDNYTRLWDWVFGTRNKLPSKAERPALA